MVTPRDAREVGATLTKLPNVNPRARKLSDKHHFHSGDPGN